MLIEANFLRSQRKITECYREFSRNNQELVSDGMKEGIEAADYQEVDLLYVAVGHQQWDSFDPQNSMVQMHEQQQAGKEDLLNFAAIYTCLKGCTVVAVEPDKFQPNYPWRQFSAINCSAPKSVVTSLRAAYK